LEIPILSTKLFIPEPRKGLVVRKRLFNKLDAEADKKLILISAPAGFGKSTLVSSWAHASGKNIAWLSLDSDDNQIARFLLYLIAALQKIDNTIGEEAAQILALNIQVPPGVILPNLINDLDKVPRDLFLVLEDFHSISSHSIHEAVAFLLEHCPRTLHMVITTRSDPLLPIARLRARGQMIELRTADLRFTNSEALQFLNDSMGLLLDEEMIVRLEARTEGWITGLQMAALSMRDRENKQQFIEDFSGSNRYIMDYLLEEVLANHPVEIQCFLLYTSILKRFSAPLCNALLKIDESIKSKDGFQAFGEEHIPQDQSDSFLDYLEKRNLFLIPLDQDRKWYRYHDLFADMLRARLQQAHPDIVRLLHLCASTWLEHNGLISEAIYHLFCADKLDRAAGLIEHYGPIYLVENDPSILQMADNLPLEMILTKPKIGVYRAWLLITQGQIGKANQLLDNLASQQSSLDPASPLRWVQTVVSLATTFLFPPVNSKDLSLLPEYSLLEEIPSDEKILRNIADFLYAMTLGRLGYLDQAVEISIKCVQRENHKKEIKAVPTLVPFLTRVYLIQGHLAKSAALCHEYLAPVKQGDFQSIYTSGSIKIDLGEVLYEWNRLKEAEQQIRAGLQANEVWQNIMTEGFGLAALARVLQAKGEYAQAIQVAEKFETRMLENSRPDELNEDFLTLKTRLQLTGGDLKNPTLWADQIPHQVDFERNKDLYRLTLARIRFAQGDYAKVEEILAEITPITPDSNLLPNKLECNLLLAAAAASRQQKPEAIALLDSCLSLAEPEGYIRIFLDIGESIRDLLYVYLQSAKPGRKQYAQKLLDAFSCSNLAATSRPRQNGLIDPLSDREIQVLRLIATGKTNREIAELLIIAPGTVKAHTSSIYRKLIVENRTEAVARARQLDILP